MSWYHDQGLETGVRCHDGLGFFQVVVRNNYDLLRQGSEEQLAMEAAHPAQLPTR